jgi:hypothetical protein
MALVIPLVVAACGSPSDPDEKADEAPPTPTSSTSPTSPAADTATMPDLVGLGSAEAGRRIGELGLGSEWGSAVVRCQAQPGTVVRQVPAAGAVITDDTVVRLRTARLDLDEFRGPCDVAELGPVTGSDAALARQFYRFAADPALGAHFVDGDVWTGIEAGLLVTTVSPARRADPSAWHLEGEYAERGGPFSALDVLAGSGGYFEVHRGIVGTCPAGDNDPPSELAGLRAISLTVPEASIDSCMNWWGVTLFLDGDAIRGVALRLGSP